MTRIIIKQVKSSIDRTKRQKDTLKALGLRKLNQEVEHTVTPQIAGMIDKVQHLITVKEI